MVFDRIETSIPVAYMLHDSLKSFQADAEPLILFPDRVQADEHAGWMGSDAGTASDYFT